MKTLNKALTLTALFAAIASPMAMADKHNRVDYARVISATPIMQTVEHRTPVETCWTEQVREERPVYHRASRKNSSATSTLLGAAIGGGIGNAVGAGSENKKVGTVVGAILGASIGNDIGRQQPRQHDRYSHNQVSYRDVRRCDVQDRVEVEQVPVGYNVTYSYRGETYTTRTNRHPGKKLKVAVSVRPLEH